MKRQHTNLSSVNKKKIEDGIMNLLDKQQFARYEIRSKMIKFGEANSINSVINILIYEGKIIEENGLIKQAEIN